MPLITVTLEPNKVQGGGADGSQAFYTGQTCTQNQQNASHQDEIGSGDWATWHAPQRYLQYSSVPDRCKVNAYFFGKQYRDWSVVNR